MKPSARSGLRRFGRQARLGSDERSRARVPSAAAPRTTYDLSNEDIVGTVDVAVEIDIAAAPADVAGVMFDPQRDPEWIKAVTAVELIDPALEPGARVRRKGQFLGKEFGWTTEVETVHFPHLLTLRIV